MAVEDDKEQLEQILALARDVIGADIVGACLHGSATLGGLRPHSDIDVLVVSRRSLTPEQRQRLVHGLLAISGSGRQGQPRPVELTVVVQSEVKPWRYPPMQDFLYGQWLAKDYRAGFVPQPEQTPDLAPLITMALLGNQPLIGPPPADLLDPVPREDLYRAITAGIDGLLADLEPDTANVLLTFARIWTTLETGQIHSKDAAADWVLRRLPEELRAPLTRARGVYLGEEEDRWDDLLPHLKPHVDYLIEAIRRLHAE